MCVGKKEENRQSRKTQKFSRSNTTDLCAPPGLFGGLFSSGGPGIIQSVFYIDGDEEMREEQAGRVLEEAQDRLSLLQAEAQRQGDERER